MFITCLSLLQPTLSLEVLHHSTSPIEKNTTIRRRNGQGDMPRKLQLPSRGKSDHNLKHMYIFCTRGVQIYYNGFVFARLVKCKVCGRVSTLILRSSSKEEQYPILKQVSYHFHAEYNWIQWNASPVRRSVEYD